MTPNLHHSQTAKSLLPANASPSTQSESSVQSPLQSAIQNISATLTATTNKLKSLRTDDLASAQSPSNEKTSQQLESQSLSIHNVLHVLTQHQPYYGIALHFLCASGDKESRLQRPDKFITQFFKAKHGGELPDPKDFLNSLDNYQTDTVTAVTSLIENHASTLIQKTRSTVQTTDRDQTPLVKLSQFISTLMQHAGQHPEQLWLYSLDIETDQSLRQLSMHLLNASENNRSDQALRSACESMKPWIEKEKLITNIQQGLIELSTLSEPQKNDKSIVISAVRANGLALEHVSPLLKTDRDVVIEAVRSNGLALQYANETFTKDVNIVHVAVHNEGNSLQYADEILKDNQDIVKTAITQRGRALEYASDNIRNNPEIVLAAVSKEARALKYASSTLQANKTIVLAAVTNGGWVLEFASDALKADKSVVLAAVRQNGSVLLHAATTLKKDKDVVLAAVTHTGFAVRYADDKLKKDLDIGRAAIQKTPWVIDLLHPRLASKLGAQAKRKKQRPV
jgi:hypothetical protein